MEWAPGARVGVDVVGDGRVVVVLAHGAGGHRGHPTVVGLRDALAARGLRVVTFDYPYASEGRRMPDRAPTLVACHRAVVEWTRDAWGGDLVLAGRSMGGRVASVLVADGTLCSALVLYAYPLHPPGRPDRLRVDHLDSVTVPTLVLQGSRDAFSRPDLFDLHIRSRFDVVDVDGADHSFEVKGQAPGEVHAFVAAATVSWLEGTVGGRRSAWNGPKGEA